MSRLDRLVSELVESGGATAAAAVVGRSGRVVARVRAGWRDPVAGEPLRRWDRFDLASLTKPWIATLALRLDAAGLLPLDTRVGVVWSEAPEPLATRSLESLLRHRSGLIAWRPFYRQVRDPRRVVERILRRDSCGAPVPTYSDLGYLLWARGAERCLGDPLELLLGRHVLRPLGLSTVGVAPRPDRAVACRMGNEREVELAAALGVAVAADGKASPGRPQDGNARYLGGLPGHAGLFAPAEAVWRLGDAWLRPGGLLEAHRVAAALGGSGRYRLGWWKPTAAPRATRALSRESFGHHGFTGGSLWIDPTRDLVAVLLVHRDAASTPLDPWRGRFHTLAIRS